MGWQFQDNTSRHDRPDLGFFRNVRGKRVHVALELKEKRQHYRPRWDELAGMPEPELLVLDEVPRASCFAARLRVLAVS